MPDNEDERFAQYRRWLLRLAGAAVLLPALAFTLWTWATLKYTYASGDRSGFVQKISKKGWVCKTWEGELAMINLPGSLPQIFPFTVREPRVAAEIGKSMGRRVGLHYEQHRGIPLSCFGETEYFVTSVAPEGASADVPAPR